MWVFIDESGDTGFKFEANSSEHFVLAAAVFGSAEEADACRGDIDDFRSALRLPPGEMKFNGSSFEIRAGFLRAVSARSFRVHSVLINKRLVEPRDFKPATKLYLKAVRLLMADLLPTLTDAEICFDRCGNRAFRSSLRKTARESLVGETWPVRRLVDRPSESDRLLQLADMVCGAIARDASGRKDGSRFRRLIAAKEQHQTVWPGSDSAHEESPPV